MTRLLRDFRILPIALVAITALFVLKSFGLILEGRYTLGSMILNGDDITGTVPERPAPPPEATPPRPPRERSWAQDVFNFPEVTGSVPAPKRDTPPGAAKAKPKGQPKAPAGIPVPIEGGRVLSPAERAVLERLSERRAELDARAHELETRESLVLAAEKRLEARLNQLKQLEARINETIRVKDENEAARFKSVVTMYENMKPKDAARVFDRLDMRVLVEVASKLNTRRMADILGQMSPETAERLTVELASRAKDRPTADLPKIEGRPKAGN